jgi:phage shock protein A
VESLERENETLKAENEDLAQSLRALKEQYRGLTERVQKFAQEVQTLAAGWLPKDQAVTEPEGQMEPVISTMADMWATGEGDVFDISNDDELGQYLQFE